MRNPRPPGDLGVSADRDGAVIAAGRRADVVLALACEVDLKVDGVAGRR